MFKYCYSNIIVPNHFHTVQLAVVGELTLYYTIDYAHNYYIICTVLPMLSKFIKIINITSLINTNS